MNIYKRLLVCILVIVLVMNCWFVWQTEAQAEISGTSGYYTYTISDGEATITDVNTEISGDVTIPSTLFGFPVTGIDTSAFYLCENITNITIPESVRYIGYRAFKNCTGLTVVNYNAVSCEDNLMASTDDPIFGGCTNLATINIGDNVIRLPRNIFGRCTALTSITIPDSVSNIGSYAFEGCTGLRAVYINDVASWSGISFGNASANPLYYADDLYVGGELLTELAVPDGVSEIGDYAFYGYTNLTDITIPDSVTGIGRYAFYGCVGLTDIAIPNSVAAIGSYAFYGCTGLQYNIYDNAKYLGNDSNPYLLLIAANSTQITSVSIYEGAKFIEGSAFEGCAGLSSVIIPDNVISVGDSAFCECDSLTSITIPDSVTSVGDSAFCECDSLTGITIPNSVTSIGQAAFSGCGSLTEVTMGSRVSIVGAYAFDLCHKLENVYITDLKAWCMIDFQYYLGTHPLYYADNLYLNGELVTDLIVPEGVTYISDFAFSYYDKLESVVIPSGVQTIGSYAFYSCNNLESITLPVSVTTVELEAFYGCDNLENVFYRGTQEDKVGISILNYNGVLKSATWYYNSCVGCAEHTYDNACDTICNVCTFERVVPDHIYDNDCDIDCNVCGLERAASDHVYDDACDSDCNVCGYTRIITHSYEWIIDQKETCGVNGKKHEECINCHVTRNEDTKIDATNDHKYDNACDTTCNVCEQERMVPDHSYTLNGNHTCEFCKYSKTPAKPVIEEKTNNSVTLVRTEGFEYSKDGISWQTSNIFMGLFADAPYTFYQRVKKSTVALVSGTSEGTSVIFKSAQTAPSAPIILSFTDTTVTLVVIPNGEYSIDGTNWQASNVFMGLSSGTKYTFYQRYAETDTYEYSNKSTGTSVTTEKAKQTLIPDAPTIQSFTSSSITLVAIDGYEYSKNGTTWQTSNVFSGLSCGTEYTFYQRYKETSYTYAGKSSEGMRAKTDKGTQSAPSKPTLSSKTYNSVILVKYSGYEYSMDGITWQTSNVFTRLSPETNYMFYQRRAENDRYYASVSSSSLTVKTKEVYESIVVSRVPSKTSYLEGQEDLDVTGGKISLCYPDGTSEIIEMTEDMVTGFDNTVVGNQTLIVNYEGYTTTFTVQIIAKSLVSIAVTTKPNKLIYLEGESFDKTGMIVTAYYNNGASENVTNFTISGYTSSSGNKTIVVTYNGKKAEFMVVVNAKPVTGTWKQNSVGWWYQYTDGTYPTNCWEKINNQWYYFNASGYRVTGWLLLGTDYYYLDSDGVRVTNCWIGNYYLKDTGIMAKNEIVDGIYVGAGGEKFTGWLLKSEGYYYYKDGTKVTGWVLVGSTWYYMDPETGVVLANEWLDDTYYLTAGGAMATGWLSVDGTWYYMSAGGTKVTNSWVGNYYMGEDGVMATNAWVDNGRYYVDASGAYVSTSGWFFLNGNYYYLAGGLKQTGWLQVGGTWYYMDPETGVMFADEWLDDTYYMTASGAMATGWLKLGESWYYMSAGGAKITNQWMGNYYLQEDGTMATNTWIGNYYVGADGAWVQ